MSRFGSIGVLTLALVAGWLALQIWLIPVHWINPDEGAHLMDARLILEGKIPRVDFRSKGIVYLLSYVPILYVFGEHYIVGRVVPILATLGSAGMLFVIGRRLFGRPAGLYAAVAFLFSPTILIDAAVVKTEPLAILLASVGVYLLVLHFQERRGWALLVAGIVIGTGYFVRQSLLGLVLVSVVLALVHYRDGPGRLLRRLTVLALGILLPWAAMAGIYLNFLPARRVFRDVEIFPLASVMRAAGHLGKVTESAPAAERDGDGPKPTAVALRQSTQLWSETRWRVEQALRLNLPFLLGLVGAASFAWYRRDGTSGRGLIVVLAWLGCLAAPYAYHVASSYFHQFYFRELLAPLALVFGYALDRALRTVERDSRPDVAIASLVVAALVLFALQKWAHGNGAIPALVTLSMAGWFLFRVDRIGRARVGFLAVAVTLPAAGLLPIGAGALTAMGILCIVLVARAGTTEWSWHRAAVFVMLGGTAAFTAVSASYAARYVDVSYDCVWSPQTVAEVVTLIEDHSDPGDQVLSAGMIWNFESRRPAFAGFTHPLAFRDHVDPEVARGVTSQLDRQWPQLIILDGYTEVCYLDAFPRIADGLRTSYQLVGQVAAREPVKVYRLAVTPTH